MNIIISGYGRMGKEVEKISNKRGHKIIAKIDRKEDWIKLKDLTDNAVIIDFSIPEVVLGNILSAFELKIPIVTGTTGWYDKLEYITDKCNETSGTLFWAPNFSIGVNLFLKTNAYLSKLMNKVDGYSVKIDETHHIHKLDAPSGTAITTAEVIMGDSKKYNDWILEKEESGKIPIYAKREGEVTGKHDVVYESEVDKILVSHEAKNRSGFALGAVLAAEFVLNKTGVFIMDDMLSNL